VIDLVPTMLNGNEASAQPGMSPPQAGAGLASNWRAVVSYARDNHNT
jgi:hypothetical protein